MSSKYSREQKLLLFLSNKEGYITSGELADLMQTSSKTIYRIVKEINQDFPNGKLIISAKGRGYKLDYEKYISSDKNWDLKSKNFTPAERRDRITIDLLLNAPNKRNVSELYEEYFLSDSVISTDEQLISDHLKQYNLELIRRNRALFIEGAEKDIRNAITDRIQTLNIIHMDDLSNKDFLDFNNYDVLYITDQMRMIEKTLNITIQYPYNINIFSHLYILISRLRRVGKKSLSDRATTKLIQTDYKNEIEYTLYEVAENTIKNIEKYINIDLPSNEVQYLYQYLMSSRMGNVAKNSTFSDEVSDITYYYLNEMGNSLNIKIQSKSIFLDLANHIKPMINRLNHGIKVHNSLLEQIKLTYETIHRQVCLVSDLVSAAYELPEINEDENGFLTLYFARIIETNQLPISTLIMCTTGIGTSELLKVKISRKFPELNILDVVATNNIRDISIKYPEAELVLSTINNDNLVSFNHLLVSAMFNDEDQDRLRKKIKEIHNER